MAHTEENVAPQQGQQPLHIEVEQRRPNMWLFVPPPPPLIVGAIELPVVRRAHRGAIFPAPTVPPLLTPPVGWRCCIFTSFFSTVPNSLVWMTFALLCYGIFIYLFQFTEFFRTRKEADPRTQTAAFRVIIHNFDGQICDRRSRHFLSASSIASEARVILETTSYVVSSPLSCVILSDCKTLIDCLHGPKSLWRWECFGALGSISSLL
ncbi:hypothetical protein LINPERPRIM_LOCUS1811 [Linum perenne]